MRHTRVFLPALLTLSLVGSLAAQQPSFGPLTSEEGAPLQGISFAPMVEGGDVTERGALSADIWLGFSSIFEQDSSETHLLCVDMERLLTAVTVRWGASERLELGGRLTLETAGGGVFDSFVLRYHQALGFGHANRDRFPSDVYEERLADGQRTLLRDAGSRSLGIDDVRIFLKWRAASSADGRSALSLKAVGWLPSQSNRVGRGRADVALMGLGRLGMGAWYLHGMLGASAARTSPELDAIVRDGAAFLSFALRAVAGLESGRGPPISRVHAAASGLSPPRARWGGEQRRAGTRGTLGRRVEVGRRLPEGRPGRHAGDRLHAGRAGEPELAIGGPAPRLRAPRLPTCPGA